MFGMKQVWGQMDSADDQGRGVSSSRPEVRFLLVGLGFVARSVGFWSAIVLPFVAIALLVAQPPGWLAGVGVVFALNVAALYLGHCHDRGC